MKKRTIILSMLMAIVMLITAVPAFADTTYTLTINKEDAGHVYEAYQIFSGDLHDGVLSNIVWGTGVTEAGKTVLGNANTKAESLTDENATDFAKEVSAYLTDVCASTSTMADGVYVISGLSAGYYLVKDKDNSLTGADDSYTSYM